MQPRLNFAVPQPFDGIQEFVLRRLDKSRLYLLQRVICIGHDIFDHKGLSAQLLPSSFQTSQLQQPFFDLLMYFDQIDLAKIRHIFAPFLSVSFRDEIGDVVALRSFPVLFLEPE